MICTKCNKEMKLVSEDLSYNFDTEPKTEYKRQRYVCQDHDIWITTEVPTKK